jgi:hypothetical protein
MTGHTANAARASAPEATRDAANLARDASLELSALEFPEFRAAREFLRPNQRVYVSHLPRQDWAQTLEMCGVLAAADFDPVPHIPVRLLKSQKELDDLLHGLRAEGVREPLLISGDYAKALGPFSNVAQVLGGRCLVSMGSVAFRWPATPKHIRRCQKKSYERRKSTNG